MTTASAICVWTAIMVLAASASWAHARIDKLEKRE
jgi:hypothetical protein